MNKRQGDNHSASGKGDSKKQKIISVEPSKGEGDSLVVVPCNSEECRKAIVEYIVLSDLPFRHVESDGFRQLIQRLQPRCTPLSRMTVSVDMYRMYLEKKEALRGILANERVSITTDTWTSTLNVNYMVVTAHWIDSHFVLHRRIISFCQTSEHKGEAIGRDIESCLRDWGIQKLFGITVDDVSCNANTVAYLKKRFSERKGGLVLGELVHVRCCARMVNLIMTDELRDRNFSITKIRNAVTYVRSLPSRLKDFKECVRAERLPCKGLLCLDVPTMWNSTYMMLETSTKFRNAFDRMRYDMNYLNYFKNEKQPREGPPEDQDWESAKMFVQLVRIFYDVTLKFSGSKHFTSNKYFFEFCNIKYALRTVADPNDFQTSLGRVARSIRDKFSQHWGFVGDSNTSLLVAVLLDPRYKVQFLGHCYSYFHDSAVSSSKVKKVEDHLRKLFDAYNELHFGVLPVPTPPKDNLLQIATTGGISRTIYSSYIQKRLDEASGKNKNEVDKYLSETLEKIVEGEVFDILKWWKDNSAKYKVLSLIARDVLAIPVSTVSSEVAFSMGQHILDPFKSSLSPKVVEGLICLKNWLSDSNEPIMVLDHMDQNEMFETSANLEDMLAGEKSSEAQSSTPSESSAV